MPQLDDHPLAAVFPLMDDDELAALADDIEANGLRDPIWLLDGQILDGRNRYRACTARDIDHRVEHYRGKDPLGFVVSKNLHRRHLDTGQRAMAAARFANLQTTKGLEIRASVASAASLFRVSVRSVDTARDVLSNGAASLIAAVDAGDVAVSAAAEVADELTKSEQKKLVASGPEKVKEKAAELRGGGATDPTPPPPAVPPVPKEWKPEGKFAAPEFVNGVLARAPTPLDDKLERIEQHRRDFTDLRTHLSRARAVLAKLLEHPQAGKYLRDLVPTDRPGQMWAYTARVIRGGKQEGGYTSPDLDRVIEAVRQARVDRVCAGCRGGGCIACKETGFVPPDPGAFAEEPPSLDFGGG